jgi:hypothetical protein
MNTVFSGGGRFLAELNLPAVPRVGERVVLDGLWIVVDVTWELKDGGSLAQVSLEQTMPAATLPS